MRISFDEEYSRIVNHLFTIGISSIAFAHNDNPGARSARDSTEKFIAERGEKMAGSVAMKNDGCDAAERAAELAKLKPKAVVLAATNEGCEVHHGLPRRWRPHGLLFVLVPE